MKEESKSKEGASRRSKLGLTVKTLQLWGSDVIQVVGAGASLLLFGVPIEVWHLLIYR